MEVNIFTLVREWINASRISFMEQGKRAVYLAFSAPKIKELLLSYLLLSHCDAVFYEGGVGA